VTNKPVIILGAGGHAKVVAEAIRLSGREIIGFVTPDIEATTIFFGSKILGDDSAVLSYSPDEIELTNGVGALPKQYLRWKLSSTMRKKGYHFATIIHPDAIIASGVVLAEGVQIMAGVVVQPGSIVGKDTIINTGVIIDHDCTIADNCHLSPGVICSGGVSVGANVHIGTGAKVIQGINIGEGSVIAAGSTVYKDIPPGILFKQKLKTVIEVVGV
jgi:sugar O-acyltransferase (sialic acid O-acetyltransferase NeuD family)